MLEAKVQVLLKVRLRMMIVVLIYDCACIVHVGIYIVSLFYMQRYPTDHSVGLSVHQSAANMLSL